MSWLGDVAGQVGRDGEADALDLGPPVPAAVSVGMPMTSPAVVTRAPPLLPGLIGALVWIASGRVAPGPPSLAGSATTRPGRGDDPAGHTAGQAERVADRQDDVAGLGLGRVTELRRLQPGRVDDPDHGQVVGRVAADEARVARGRVAGSWTLNVVASRDVGVGDNVAGRSSTTPEPRPSPVLISTTEGSTWRTTSA